MKRQSQVRDNPVAHLPHYRFSSRCSIRIRQDESIRCIVSESTGWGYGRCVDVENRWRCDLLWFDFVSQFDVLTFGCVGERDVD